MEKKCDNKQIMLRKKTKHFCLDLVNVNKGFLIEKQYESYEPYWIKFQEELKIKQKVLSENQQRDSIWKTWLERKEFYQNYYNEQEVATICKSIADIKREIDVKANILAREENAVGFKIRELEKYIETELLNKRTADYYVSSFLEKVFGYYVLSDAFNKIEGIKDRADKILRESLKAEKFSKEDWICFCRLADKNNYSCDTCWKIYKYFHYKEAYYDKECSDKRNGNLCPIEKVIRYSGRAFSDLLGMRSGDSLKIENFRNLRKTKWFEQQKQLINTCLTDIKSSSPVWAVKLNMKRVNITISIFVALILLLIIRVSHVRKVPQIARVSSQLICNSRLLRSNNPQSVVDEACGTWINVAIYRKF